MDDQSVVAVDYSGLQFGMSRLCVAGSGWAVPVEGL